MEINNVLIGPYTLGQIYGVDEALNDKTYFKGFKKLKFSQIIYNSLLQSGCKYFEVVDPYDRIIKDASEVIKQKLIFLNDFDYGVNILLVKLLFYNYLPKDYEDKKEYKKIVKLEYFLWDVLTCFSRRTSLAMLSDIPNINEYSDMLPIELLLPIKRFFESIGTTQITLPAVIKKINREDVALLEEIFKSSLYNDYANIYFNFKNSGFSRNIEEFKKIVDKFVHKHPNLIIAKEVCLKLIPNITSLFLKSINSEFSNKLFSSLKLSTNQTITIYNLNTIQNEALESRTYNLIKLLKK